MTDHKARNAQILDALKGESAQAVADRFGLSRSYIYRLRSDMRRNGHGDGETFQANARPTGPTFREIGTSGLRQFAGNVDEDYDRVFKPLYRKIQLYREMGDDPIAAAVLMATKMTIRRLSWSVEPAGETRADEQAAEFLDGCMNDMSHSWNDAIDWALDMLQYGFVPMELVYKRRLGDARDPASNHDDGKIGWRKWIYIGQDTLAQNEPWLFDEHGGIQGFRQQDPNMGTPSIEIPVEKTLLFRTTARKNDPEGRAILRAMYPAWYMKKNLEEIEAISAERFGSGLPVIYLGSDTSRTDDADSDLTAYKSIVRNIRVDEQMGVVNPYAKMGAGALEGQGVLVELLTPSGGRPVVLDTTIQRYEKRMAMVGLAQFIHLGMDKVGTQALAGETVDFFTLAVAAWADLIEETIHRFGTERLFRLNHFPGLTSKPRIAHSPVFKQSLIDVATFVEKMTGVGLLTPDPELEAHIRELGDLPEKPIEVIQQQQEETELRREQMRKMLEAGKKEEGGETEKEETEAEDESPQKPGAAGAEEATEIFQSDLRGGGPGRRPKAIVHVNAYQRELEDTYADWSDDLARDLAAAEDDDRREEILAAALAALLLRLRQEGRESMAKWLSSVEPTPEVLQALADAVAENDRLLEQSLLPAVERKIRGGLQDEDILRALALGTGAAALAGLLATGRARVALYAGGLWSFMQHAIGLGALDRVYWHLDPLAHHCPSCLAFGNKEYESFDAMLRETGGVWPSHGVDCDGNCRCSLEAVREGLSDPKVGEIFYGSAQPRDRTGKWTGGIGGGAAGRGEAGDISIERVAPGKTPKSVTDDIKTWDGDRRDVALGTITSRSGNDILLVKDGKELVGVVGMRPDRLIFPPQGVPKGKYDYIDGIATKRAGYGRQTMNVAISHANGRGRGLLLTANVGPVEFYKKLGMHQLKSDKRSFYWTPKEVSMRAGK